MKKIILALVAAINQTYLIEKIRRAWASGSLKEQGFRFIVNQVQRYIATPLKSSIHFTKNLELNLVDGFKDHRSSEGFLEIKSDHIARIIKAYKKAKRDQKNSSPEFVIKGVWDEWISVNYKELIAGLDDENIELLRKLFNNILREQCTRGMGSYDEYSRYNSLFGKSYLKIVWIDYYRKLIDIKGEKDINIPKAGNPSGIIYKKKLIPIEALRHAYRAEEIKNIISDLDEKIIVEIGGGYGGLCFQLASKLKNFKGVKFSLFDIPEVVAIASSFLMTSLPDKNIRLYGEGKISSDTEGFDIAIFPHFAIDNLNNNSVDIFYNSCSFSEMDELASSHYLSVIERCCRKYFMHDNHDVEFIRRQSDGTFSKNIIGSKLIPNPNFFKLLYKKPRTHGLPEDRAFKQFEYLYERAVSGAS